MTWLLLLQLSLPNAHVTPGEVRPLTVAVVCATKWGLDRRHVTTAMKRHVANEYGVPWEDRWLYEFDHLIPRELGGADTEANLWPQPLPEARMKDREENSLHRTVCNGGMALAAAQAHMRQWGRSKNGY